MAEEKSSGKISGWIKAVCTSIFGLVSGAALMYLTPLVNNVIKPGKPVANFAQQVNGLTVTFNNRSTGGTQGWWDFGDGSALEPYEPHNDTVTHAYARPGKYNVKLTLQNLLGEDGDRTVEVNLENSQATAPSIDIFSVQAINPKAPALFKVYSQVKNAKLVAWGLGDEPLKQEAVATSEKLLTVNEPGYYTLRLVAFNGDQVTEKLTPISVDIGDGNKPMATLKVIYDGVEVERKVEHPNLVLAWDPKVQGATSPVTGSLAAPAGWTIAEATYDAPKADLIRNLKIEASPDRTKLQVTAEMLKPKTLLTGKILPPPHCGLHVTWTLVKRSAAKSVAVDPVMVELTAPGSTAVPLPPAPAGLEVQNKRIALEIKDGQQTIWSKPGLPSAAQVAMRNKVMSVTALEQSGQLRVDILEAKSATPVSRPR